MRFLASLFKQTFFQGLGKIVTSISTFIILGLIARTYQEAGTGIFTLALTYLGIFYLLADFGFNAHVLKRVTNSSESLTKEWDKLFGARIFWSLILIFLAIFSLLFWPFATKEFSQSILYGSVAILGSGVFVTCNLIFQSKHRYDLSVLASSIGTIAGLAFYLWVSESNPSIALLLLGQTLTWIIISLLCLAFTKKYVTSLVPTFELSYIKKLFKESWPIAATLALNVVYFRIDTFLLAYYRNISDVGVYNVAYSVFQSALVIPTFIMNAYYPLMLKSLSKIRLVGVILLGLSVFVTLLTYYLSPWIIQLLTGGNFIGSVQSLRILSLSFPAFFVSALLMWLLVTQGKYKQMLFIYLIGLLINLLMNFILIPQYSFIGASTTTVVSEYLILLMQAVVLFFK